MRETFDANRADIGALLERTVRRNRHLHGGILLLHSDAAEFTWRYASGDVSGPDQPFHIASIGKAFTSVLIGMLVDEQRLSYDDHAADYLEAGVLDGLHVIDGTDNGPAIRIRHLLNHTSGLPDYFEEKPKRGPRILDLVVNEPDRFWTPHDTIAFAKEYLPAHAPPGKKFHYSDTGYQLLGLIIEHVTGNPMHQSLHQRIFTPLGMDQSYQLFYSNAAALDPPPMAKLHLGAHEVSQSRSVSVDWAGGGIVSTTDDLLRFHRALTRGELVSRGTLQAMQTWTKWQWGLDYGYGLVRMRVKRLYPLLPGRFDSWGNWGSTATFMFHAPAPDVYFIGAFNQTKFIMGQVRFMLRVLSRLSKVV